MTGLEAPRPMVVLVGVGALGSHFAPLVRNHVRLRAVDHDRVEGRNTLAQSHGRTAIGRNKAEALRSAMNFSYRWDVEARCTRLAHTNYDVLFAGADIVVDATDNAEARHLAKRAHVPVLHGALAQGGVLGRVFWDVDFAIDPDDATPAPTCEHGEFLPFIALVASVMAVTLVHFVSTQEKRGFFVRPTGVERIV